MKNYITILFISSVLWLSCENKNKGPSSQIDIPIKKYLLDENGFVQTTEISVSDFESAKNCQDCHFNHYQEWSKSMHAYSMQDPIFFFWMEYCPA